MTERLYYNDGYRTEFDAAVLQVDTLEGRPAAVLDRTAFYPTSGGQPFDTGRLGQARVVDVVDRDDGVILHVVEGPIAPGPVHGVVDWNRRFEHMQQHSGQHVLSAAFDRLFDARTESFHLGTLSSTIDLNRTLTPADMERAVDEANRIVWEDRPVTIRFVDAAEAAGLPLRKEPARTGMLRLVEVADFDISACGGTHVARTGAIGTIVVASFERFRGGTRIEFMCGMRTLHAYRVGRDALAASVRLVSVLPSELPAAVERLQTEVKEGKRLLKDAHSRLAVFEAAALVERSQGYGPVRLVAAALEGWDPNALKSIAAAIATRPGHVAALFSAPAPSAAVVARAPDAAVDCAAMLRRVLERFGGKGGGRPEMAQGGGLQGSPEEFVSFTMATFSSAISQG